MRGICESVLEARLERLVRRLKFDEAEKFARQYKLPVAPVHRGRTSHIMERLSPWRKEPFADGEEDRLVEELKRSLGNFDDLAYLVECCATAGGNSIALFWNEKCPKNWNANWNKITF